MTDLLTRVRGRLSYANITATLALFIALGGGAYAATSLPRHSVGSAQLRAHAVTASKIRHSAVRSGAIRNRSIELRDISTSARAALKGEQGAPGPAGPAAIADRAAVNSGGTEVVGTARQSVDHPGGSNSYTLQFGHDVSACVYSATLAAVQNGPTVEQPPAGRITVASGGGANVVVHTFDASGAPAPAPFHLLVSC
jgi:hypothetical protein